MSKNEEIIGGEVRFNMSKSRSGEGVLWKKLGLGTAAGILLGAGALYGYDKLQNGTIPNASIPSQEPILEDKPVDNQEQVANQEHTDDNDHVDHDAGDNVQPEENHTSLPPVDVDDPDAVIYDRAPVAFVEEDMTFDEAFATARDVVGPGGVFSWHGGIYSTYTVAEWDAMSDAQQMEYAQSVHPQVIPQYVPADAIEDNPDLVIHVNLEPYGEDGYSVAEIIDGEVVIHAPEVEQQLENADLLNYDMMDGHDVVILDTDLDGEADKMVVDSDDSGDLSKDDVVVNLSDGSISTVEDLIEPEHFIEGDAVVAYDQVDGSDAAFIDTDYDGKANALIIDADGSNGLSPDDVVVNYDENVVATLGELVDNDNMDLDMPDYADDAPVS